MKNPYSEFVKQKKEELRNIVQHAKQLTELELWLEKLTKGVVPIVDKKGHLHY